MDGNKGWPSNTIVDGVPDIESVEYALRNTKYGQCIYESDNDVCDNQVSLSVRAPSHTAQVLTHRKQNKVVNLEFANGATASFTMVAQTSLICERQSRLHFSNGEIVGDMSSFTVTDFRKNKVTKHTPKLDGGGHGGGDLGLIKSFVEAVRTGSQVPLGTDVSDVLKSHITVFAAETSRKEGRVVDCVAFEKEAREKMAL